MTIDAKPEQGGGAWRKIELSEAEMEFSKVSLKLKQIQTDGESQISKALCTYAAISEEPKFTDKTRVVRFTAYETD